MTIEVAVLVGSLRNGSFSKAVADAIAELAAPRLALKQIEIGDLPLYNPDLDENTPPAWQRLRDDVGAAQAVLFVTPEYNRSVPASLKNAIDIGSRPYGQSVWNNKPAAIVSNSPGMIGGFGANHHLRQSLVFLNMPILQQPEMYLSKIDGSIDGHGKLTGESTLAFLSNFVDAYVAWIERVS
jgi:chromate reductase